MSEKEVVRRVVPAVVVSDAVNLGAILRSVVEQLAESCEEPGDLLLAMVPRGKGTGFLVVPAEKPTDANAGEVPA